MWILILFFILVVVLPLAAFMLVRSRGRVPSSQSDLHKFRAVSIRIDPDAACPAARAMDMQHFLGADAPKLPLPECTAETCTCTFEHHADRRQGPRRAGEAGVFEGRFEGLEHRGKPDGRRVEDLPEATGLDRDSGNRAPDLDAAATYYDFVVPADTGPKPAK